MFKKSFCFYDNSESKTETEPLRFPSLACQYLHALPPIRIHLLPDFCQKENSSDLIGSSGFSSSTFNAPAMWENDTNFSLLLFQLSQLSTQFFYFSSSFRHRGRCNRLNQNLQRNELSHLRHRSNFEIVQAPVVFTNSSVIWNRMVGWT